MIIYLHLEHYYVTVPYEPYGHLNEFTLLGWKGVDKRDLESAGQGQGCHS